MADFDDTADRSDDLDPGELDIELEGGLDGNLDDELDDELAGELADGLAEGLEDDFDLAEALEGDLDDDELDDELAGLGLEELDEDDADESLDELAETDDPEDGDDDPAGADADGESTALVEGADDLLDELEEAAPTGRDLLVDDEVRAGEFVCRSCFMAKRESALADEENLLCRDCV